MRVILCLLLLVCLSAVSAKYLPNERASTAVLSRHQRAIDDDESSSSSNDSTDDKILEEAAIQAEEEEKKDLEEQGNQQEEGSETEEKLDKESRKKLEEERKRQEKKEKEERKRQEKTEKEERKRQLKLEKEERKRQEKLAKREKKREQSLRKQIKKLGDGTLENVEPDSSESTEVDITNNDIDLDEIWKGYIYDKYGLSAASSKLEKLNALNKYYEEELGLNVNSTKSEKRQAIIKMLSDASASESASDNSLKTYVRDNVNEVAIENLRNKTEKRIVKLDNVTSVLENETWPWVPETKAKIAERRTLMQAIVDFLTSLTSLLTAEPTQSTGSTPASGDSVDPSNMNNASPFNDNPNSLDIANSGAPGGLSQDSNDILTTEASTSSDGTGKIFGAEVTLTLGGQTLIGGSIGSEVLDFFSEKVEPEKSVSNSVTGQAGIASSNTLPVDSVAQVGSVDIAPVGSLGSSMNGANSLPTQNEVGGQSASSLVPSDNHDTSIADIAEPSTQVSSANDIQAPISSSSADTVTVEISGAPEASTEIPVAESSPEGLVDVPSPTTDKQSITRNEVASKTVDTASPVAAPETSLGPSSSPQAGQTVNGVPESSSGPSTPTRVEEVVDAVLIADTVAQNPTINVNNDLIPADNNLSNLPETNNVPTETVSVGPTETFEISSDSSVTPVEGSTDATHEVTTDILLFAVRWTENVPNNAAIETSTAATNEVDVIATTAATETFVSETIVPEVNVDASSGQPSTEPKATSTNDTTTESNVHDSITNVDESVVGQTESQPNTEETAAQPVTEAVIIVTPTSDIDNESFATSIFPEPGATITDVQLQQ